MNAKLRNCLSHTAAPWAHAGSTTFVAHRDASEPVHGRQLAHWLHNHLPAVQLCAHAAGLPGFNLIDDLTCEQFIQVVSPKVSCHWPSTYMECQHQATNLPNCMGHITLHSSLQVMGASALGGSHLTVLSTVFFSSTSAVWSQAGAAHYSGSNCYLDYTAHAWQGAGQPATSINFGPFGDIGMAASLRYVPLQTLCFLA